MAGLSSPREAACRDCAGDAPRARRSRRGRVDSPRSLAVRRTPLVSAPGPAHSAPMPCRRESPVDIPHRSTLEIVIMLRIPRSSFPWLALLAIGLAGPALPTQAQVGLSELRLADLPVTLVYPTAAVASPRAMGPFTIEVAKDGAPSPGRHRLVVMSHGTGGSVGVDHSLAATLARAGFVVAQPLHAGDNFRDQSQAGPVAFHQRPIEVSRVIDALAQDPVWSARLDLDRVGVHGMSAGGVTGLALAGAQWRLLDLVRHCDQASEADAGFCFQGAKDPDKRAQRLAQFAGTRGVPEVHLPEVLKTVHGGRTPTEAAPDPRPDPRVAAVTLAVPVAAPFTAESLARVRIPVGLVRADEDQVLVPRFHADHVLANCRSCTLLVDLPGAGHFDVLWPWPPAVARQVAEGQVRGGEVNPAFDPALRQAAHDRIAAFHRQHLGVAP